MHSYGVLSGRRTEYNKLRMLNLYAIAILGNFSQLCEICEKMWNDKRIYIHIGLIVIVF